MSPFSDDLEFTEAVEAAPEAHEHADDHDLEGAERWYVAETGPSPFTEIESEAKEWWEAEDFDFAQAEDEAAHPILSVFHLPAAVREALSGGLSSLAVRLAAGAGYNDVNQLTSIVFYFRHPEMVGRKIQSDQRDLAAEWISIRDRIVKPSLLSVPAGTPSPIVARTPPVSGTAFSSSLLAWPEASADGLAFMKAVYEGHAARSRASGGSFVADLPESALNRIEGHQARKDAAEAARALLAEARAALTADGLSDKVRIGITSAYRPATRQFEIWQGRTWDGKSTGGGFPHYYRDAVNKGIVRAGDFGPAAVEKIVQHLRRYIASPGFSNHQHGLAFDFGTGEVAKKGLGKIGWKSWFRRWLERNARRFGFSPLATEAWHWTYSPSRVESGVWSREVSAPTIGALGLQDVFEEGNLEELEMPPLNDVPEPVSEVRYDEFVEPQSEWDFWADEEYDESVDFGEAEDG